MHKLHEVKKIRKPQARKGFDMGRTVYLQSSNFAFSGVWSNAIPIVKDVEHEKSRREIHDKWHANEPERWIPEFDLMVNNFEFYNCPDNETGKYAHFYVPNTPEA